MLSLFHKMRTVFLGGDSVECEEESSVPLLGKNEKSYINEVSTESNDGKSIIHERRQLQNISQFFLVAVCFVSALNMVGSAQYTYVSSYEEQIGIQEDRVSYLWLIGPILSLISRMFVGLLSDMIWIPFLGRRKPFLLLSTLMLCFSLFLFSYSDILSRFFPPSHSGTATIVIVVISSCTIQASLNMANSSAQTLFVDTVPVQQLKSGTVWNIWVITSSKAIGALICYIDFREVLPLPGFVRFNVTPAFTIVIICCLVAFFFTFCCVREKKEIILENIETEQDYISETNDCCSRCCEVLPMSMILLYATRFSLLAIGATKHMYFGVICARQVFSGDPSGTEKEQELFGEGIRWAGIILFSHYAICSLVMPLIFVSRIFDRLPMKLTWSVCELLDILGFIIVFFVRNKWWLLIVYNLFFFAHEFTHFYYPQLLFNVIVKTNPFMRSKRGIYNALFYSSSFFPAILMALLGGVLIDVMEKIWVGNGVSGMLLLCVGFSVAAIAFMVFVPMKKINL